MWVIFFLSSRPGDDIPSWFVFQDAAAHFIMYAVLSFLFSSAVFNSRTETSGFKLVIWACVFGLAYGVSDEFHQHFVPGRTVSALDVIHDGVGSLFGSIIFLRSMGRRKS
jgi:VanZ family protein